jgi:hypothetical protein
MVEVEVEVVPEVVAEAMPGKKVHPRTTADATTIQRLIMADPR